MAGCQCVMAWLTSSMKLMKKISPPFGGEILCTIPMKDSCRIPVFWSFLEARPNQDPPTTNHQHKSQTQNHKFATKSLFYWESTTLCRDEYWSDWLAKWHTTKLIEWILWIDHILCACYVMRVLTNWNQFGMSISPPFGGEIFCVLCYGTSTVISPPNGGEI